MKTDRIYLQHIVDAVDNIDKFIKGVKKDSFVKNVLVHSAVIRQLEIIGEAVKKVSVESKRKHKDIPWRDIGDLRNKLIHEYFGVDLSLVWIVCKRDIPTLKQAVKSIIAEIK